MLHHESEEIAGIFRFEVPRGHTYVERVDDLGDCVWITEQMSARLSYFRAH